MDENAASSEGKEIIPPDQIIRDVKFGQALMGTTGMLTVASFAGVCMLMYETSASILFSFGGWSERNSSMTACFMVVLVWWTIYSMSLFLVNVMLTKSYKMAEYDFVYKWSPEISVMNALGTNVAIVAGLVFFFSDRQYSGLIGVGVVLYLLGLIQIVLSLMLFGSGRPPPTAIKDEPAKLAPTTSSFNC